MSLNASVAFKVQAPPTDSSAPGALRDHPHRSATTIDGWKSALFGLPFLAVGIFMAVAAFRAGAPHGTGLHIAQQSRTPAFPIWAAAILDLAFLGGGAFFVLHGVSEEIGNWRYRRAAAADPGAVWLYDFRWRAEGFTFSAFNTMVSRLLAALGWDAFLLPFAWVGLEIPGKWPFLAAAAALGLAGLYFWYRWGVSLLDLLRYGNTFLRYDTFPYILGATLRAHLRAPRHLGDIDELTFTLRCIQERYVTTGTGRDRQTSVVCDALYEASTTVPREQLSAVRTDGIPIQFAIPSGLPATALATHPPTYWEIEADGAAQGASYQAYFLVPIYARAGQPD